MSAQGFFQFLLKGGPLVWPILFCSVAGLAILLERISYMHGVKKKDQWIMEKIGQGDSLFDLRELANMTGKKEKGPLGGMLGDLSKVDRGNRHLVEAVFDYHIDQQVASASRYLDTLALLSSISPLLGLLGTVTGLIKAFMVIEGSGGKVNAAMLAGGIWEAMLTTAIGLCVGIILVLGHKYLAYNIKKFEEELQRIAFQFFVDTCANGAKADRAVS